MEEIRKTVWKCLNGEKQKGNGVAFLMIIVGEGTRVHHY